MTSENRPSSESQNHPQRDENDADLDGNRPTPEAVEEENRRIRRLRFIMSLTTADLMQGDHSLQEARAIVERARRAAVALFPGKGDVFDLVLRPRLHRIILERYGPVNEDIVH